MYGCDYAAAAAAAAAADWFGWPAAFPDYRFAAAADAAAAAAYAYHEHPCCSQLHCWEAQGAACMQFEQPTESSKLQQQQQQQQQQLQQLQQLQQQQQYYGCGESPAPQQFIDLPGYEAAGATAATAAAATAAATPGAAAATTTAEATAAAGTAAAGTAAAATAAAGTASQHAESRGSIVLLQQNCCFSSSHRIHTADEAKISVLFSHPAFIPLTHLAQQINLFEAAAPCLLRAAAETEEENEENEENEEIEEDEEGEEEEKPEKKEIRKMVMALQKRSSLLKPMIKEV
ncbi:hypothetical protein, conserved [Eimeria brunetti]|uniref:Uncharacterized protein n=1 Tax=Eimeria brunetti TaxID=51314 RepID=U6LIL4_9EIME|nr:hypothetical protein, conserved [Eimeria brunetti]